MSRPGSGWKIWAALLLALFLSGPGPAGAEGSDPRRVLVGVKVFTSLLAADQELTERAEGGTLNLIVLRGEDAETAAHVRERLLAVGTLRGLNLTVTVLTPGALAEYTGPRPAGLFVSDWLSDLRPALGFAQHHHTVLFSPVLGDVARGAHAGLHVSDRILPVVNEAALLAAGIRLKPFFLEIARRHELD